MSNAELPGDKPMNYAQAAAFLGWKEYTLREKTNAGIVPHARVGRQVMFLPSVLLEWIKDESLTSLRTQPVKADTAVRRKQRRH